MRECVVPQVSGLMLKEEQRYPSVCQVKRIVGGRSAEPGLFPWQVLLSVEDLSRVPEDRWFGSGALLSESWILTAAHVLRSQRRDTRLSVLQVFLGLHSIRDKHSSTSRSVDQIFLHPDFQPNNYNNDIALLRLSERVEFNRMVLPICLPPAHSQVRRGLKVSGRTGHMPGGQWGGIRDGSEEEVGCVRPGVLGWS
ncbi:hypothetical protein XENOCAPTIV_007667 [Xenoophorus captivus]|uniref:Peptidase S1 domain-containing protein n=1 Tax=Xenoophorus captivus TaxID=1517983 RepID=A0ABV0S695_9TELE